MDIHADFTRRVVVRPQDHAWLGSPAEGVARMPFDRIGDPERARVTALVRFAPGAAFEAHGHEGGEELLVLEGAFADEHGDYPAGFYLRNPPGSRHAPRTPAGCLIFVKLRQFAPGDAVAVRLDTRAAAWPAAPVARLALHAHGPEATALERWAPGAAPGTRDYPGGAELFVLEGSLEDEAGDYPAGTWLRLPPGSGHAPRTAGGCRLYLKTGHLVP